MARIARRTLRGRLNKAKNPSLRSFFYAPSVCLVQARHPFGALKKPTFKVGFFGFVAGTGLEPVTLGYEPDELPLLHPAMYLFQSIVWIKNLRTTDL